MVASASGTPPSAKLILGIGMMLFALHMYFNVKKHLEVSRKKANEWKIFKGMWDDPGHELTFRAFAVVFFIAGLIGSIEGSWELIRGTHGPASVPVPFEQTIPHEKEPHHG